MSKILSLGRRVYDWIHDEPHGRTTDVRPGVVATEPGQDTIDPKLAAALTGWRKNLPTPDAIAQAVGYAIEQPEGVDIDEVIVRPTAADMGVLGVPVP